MARPSDAPPVRHPPDKLTYDDYANFLRNGRRHELIDGEHFVTPSPVRRHQQLSLRLVLAIGTYLRHHPVGELYDAPLDVILSERDVVEPDILFVSAERASILQDWVCGPPDLIVEILSEGTRKVDEIMKRRLYDRVGVREYWIVDPELEQVKIHRRADDGSFPRVLELTRGEHDTLSTPMLPGFSLALDDLFR